MPNLNGDLPVEVRRILFVKKRMRERGAESFAKSDDIVRQLAPVAVNAVQEFDRNEYVNDWMRFVDTDQADATQMAIMMRVLNYGCERVQARCDAKHEPPKQCDCAEIQEVLMGFAQPVEQLPDVLETDES